MYFDGEYNGKNTNNTIINGLTCILHTFSHVYTKIWTKIELHKIHWYLFPFSSFFIRIYTYITLQNGLANQHLLGLGWQAVEIELKNVHSHTQTHGNAITKPKLNCLWPTLLLVVGYFENIFSMKIECIPPEPNTNKWTETQIEQFIQNKKLSNKKNLVNLSGTKFCWF